MMPKTYTVIQDYKNSNPDPIELKAGDVVGLGEIFKDNELWPNWIECVSHRTGKRGWTPIQLLNIDGTVGVAVTDYTAKEMTVVVGDMIDGYKELNGWIWCVREVGEICGWVPQACLKEMG